MGQLIRQIKKKNGLIRRFAEEEDAVGVVEIILILVVLIGLVIIFKEQLTELVQSILSKIAKQSNSIYPSFFPDVPEYPLRKQSVF